MGAEAQTSQKVTLLVWNLHTSIRWLVCGPGSCAVVQVQVPAVQVPALHDWQPKGRKLLTTSCRCYAAP